MTPSDPSPTGAALAAGAAGAVLFVLVFTVDGATRRGYEPRRHPVSALALGPRGPLQTANFLVFGVLTAAGAAGLLLSGGGSTLLPVAVAAIGLALIASGLFPMDPMRGYPPGAPEGTPNEVTPRHRLHDSAGTVVFGGLPIAAALAAFAVGPLPWRIFSAATAAVLAVLAARFATAWEADSPRTGLIQRAFLCTACAWLAALFLHVRA
ncbi:DUF998 domain-containing protein [Nocardiopsis coralliicola]